MASADARNEARLAAAAKAAKAAADKQAAIDAATAATVAAGGKSTDSANRLPGETASEANARITQGYKDQPAPELTKEGAAAGATVQFVRTGAGGVGTYKEVFPIGTPIPETRTTTSGNVYDVQGNLVSGSGLKTANTATAASNPTLSAGGSSAGNDASGREVFYKSESGNAINFYYADGSKVSVDNLVGIKQAVDFASAGYSVQGLEKGVTPGSIKYANIIKDAENRGQVKGSDAYAVGDVYVTRDFNGVSIYDKNGNLVSGKGSQYQVGIGGVDGSKVNISAVGAFGTPEYDLRKAYKDSSGNPLTSVAGSNTPTEINQRPVGTPPAYVYDAATKTYKMPTKPTSPGTWVFDANNGWVDTTVVPGSSGIRADGTKTLALDTFKNTLGLLFGPKEAGQPWVNALYASASKFYNSGSTIDESINLSLQDIRYNKDLKPFTDRFNGIYALTDRLAKGEAIEVPTIAEYFKSESAMGDVLRAAGMGELANQNFLGGIIGMGKSVLEVTNLITDTFDRIDNAPSALKADLQAYFPGADRTSIAKAMLTGEKGAAELTKKVKAISVQSAAKTQGVNINDLTSEDIAAQGYDYNKSLDNFATVKQLERGQSLGRMSNIDLTQQEAIASTFQSNAAAAEKIRKIREEEANRFSGSSGRFASKDRAQSII